MLYNYRYQTQWSFVVDQWNVILLSLIYLSIRYPLSSLNLYLLNEKSFQTLIMLKASMENSWGWVIDSLNPSHPSERLHLAEVFKPNFRKGKLKMKRT